MANAHAKSQGRSTDHGSRIANSAAKCATPMSAAKFCRLAACKFPAIGRRHPSRVGRYFSHSYRRHLPYGLGSVALFEADRVAQSGHRFLERVVLDGAGGHQRGERLGDDVELFLRGLGAAAPGVLQQSD